MFDELNKLLDFASKIPIAEKTEQFTDWLTSKFAFLFDVIKDYFGNFMDWTADALTAIPPTIFILVIAVIAFFLSGKKFGLAAFSIVGLWLIYNQEYWSHMIETLSLVIVASILSVIIGIPTGILMSKSRIAETIITPVLDFMKTIPALIYILYAVAFFGFAMIQYMFASLTFTSPPTVLLTY